MYFASATKGKYINKQTNKPEHERLYAFAAVQVRPPVFRDVTLRHKVTDPRRFGKV